MSTLRPFNIKIKLQANMKGRREKRGKPNNTYKSPNRLQQLSFSSIILFKTLCCVIYLTVALRISELESTDNLSSPYSISLSIRAFERFGKSYGCNVEFTLSRRMNHVIPLEMVQLATSLHMLERNKELIVKARVVCRLK